MTRAKVVQSPKFRVQSRGRRALCTLHFALAGLSVVGLSGCTDWAGYDLDYLYSYVPFLSTMRGSVSYDPYELPRVPAEHSIPVSSPMGDAPPRFEQAQLDSAAATLTNPYATPTPEVLARGQEMYQRQCTVCHGPQGAGNGPVVGAGKFPFAPPINNALTAGRSDGYIYGVIAVGRGLMPSYGERLTHLDRWAVVSYVRALQRQGGASPAAAPATPPTTPAPVTTPAGAQSTDTASGAAGAQQP